MNQPGQTTNFDEKASTWDQNPQTIERASAIAAAMQRRLPLQDRMRGFEYGCGTGTLSFILSPLLQHITLADTSEGMLEVLKGKIRDSEVTNMSPVLLDLTQADAPAGVDFDLIYTAMTLHHVADTDRLLRIFNDMLVPGGYLCISDLDEEDGSFHSGAFAGHRGFDRQQLESVLKQAGFENVGFETCYTIRKEREGVTDEYPVFLMTCGRRGS